LLALEVRAKHHFDLSFGIKNFVVHRHPNKVVIRNHIFHVRVLVEKPTDISLVVAQRPDKHLDFVVVQAFVSIQVCGLEDVPDVVSPFNHELRQSTDYELSNSVEQHSIR
jgi:hypothetical protein